MLTEANPKAFTAAQTTGRDAAGQTNDPISLFNRAWTRYRDDPASYRGWERQLIDDTYPH